MKNLETPINEIFGLVDEALDRVERNGRPKKVKPRNPSALPKLKVRRSAISDEMSKVSLGNAVYVPDSVLKSLTSSLNKETGSANTLLLKHLMPLLLSYQTSTNYARAALKEGLDIEVDFDPGLADCIKHIGYLNVVMHYIRRSKLPLSVKKRFIAKFSEGLATQAVTSMVEENKLQTRKTLQDHLEAVVYSRQKDKVEVRKQADTKELGEGQSSQPKRPAVRRSRRD